MKKRKIGVSHLLLSCLLVSFLLLSCKKDVKPTQVSIEEVVDSIPQQEEIVVFDTIPKKYLIGKVDYTTDSLFARIPDDLTTKHNVYLHKDALASYKKMAKAAAEDGVYVKINSAARNFNYQKSIWLRKWKGYEQDGLKGIAIAQKILLYSSMPGTSRHHWGTEIDLNSFNNKHFASGKGLKTYNWLTENADQYGFCQTYTAMDSLRNTGYQEEKWHWSYVPVAEKYTEAYARQVTYADIAGYKGSEFAEPMRMIPDFVLGIHPSCRE